MTASKKIDKLQTASVTSKSHTVRIAVVSGNPMFAICDIVGACTGTKSGRRTYYYVNDPTIAGDKTKILYPVEKNGGFSYTHIQFADLTAAKEIMEKLRPASDIRSWLEKDVFTYTIQEAPKKEIEPIEAPYKESVNVEVLDKAIDQALFAILDIKKQLHLAAR